MSTVTAVPAGGRRFWVVVFCFAVANAGVWVGYDRWQTAHRHHLLEVIQFTPGDGASVNGAPTLRWTFNLDVAPIVDGRPPGEITPAVAGKWKWEDGRNLTFTPEALFPRATAFKVSLSDALHTPDGFRMARPYVAGLATDALKVISARQVQLDDNDRVLVELAFNENVAPSSVQQHLSLRGPDGREIPFQPQGDLTGRTVRVLTDSIARTRDRTAGKIVAIDVTLSKGLAGTSGPLALEADYHDKVVIDADLLATGASAYFPSHDDPFIEIRFNNAVAVEDLRGLLSVVPAVPYTLTQDYQGVHLNGPFEPGARYQVKLARPAKAASNRHSPRPTAFSVRIPDRQAGIWFESEVGYLSAEGNRTVLAHVVNTADLRATVTRVYDNNLVAWRNSTRHGYWADLQFFARPVAVRDLHLPARKNQKQDVRLSLDDLLPAGEARDGVYQISLRSVGSDGGSSPISDNLLSDDENDGGYYYGGASTMVTLSDIGLSAKQGREGVTVWATSLRTAKPLPNIHVRIFSNKNQLLGDATTEVTGVATIVTAPAGPGEKPAVVIADQQLAAEVRDEGKETDGAVTEARKAAAHENGAAAPAGHGLTWLDLREGNISFGDSDVGGRAYLRRGYEAFIYSDRGVYRPGETVHLRAIVRGPDNAKPQRFPIRWQIRRPDLHDWKAQMAEIDADGATSFDLVLPADLPTGRWSAHVGLPGEAGMTSRFFGSASFEVEDFMPQRMKVSVDIDGAAAGANKGTDRILLGDNPVAAHVQADYLFGRPVTERPATMVVRVDPVAFRPLAYRDWTFGDEAHTAEALGKSGPLGRRAELAATELDAKGHAKWDIDVAELIDKGEIDAPADGTAHLAAAKKRGHARPARAAAADAPGASDYAGPWRLTVSGSVTETGGRAISATRQIEVDRVASYIGLRPRQTSARPDVACTYDVQLVTPAGEPAATDASLQFTLLRETWNSSYILEHARYRFRSTRILEPAGKGMEIAAIRNGRGEITFTPPASGSYVLLLRDPRTQCTTSVLFYAGYGAWEDNISRENPERLELIVQPAPRARLLDAALSALARGDLPGLLGAVDHAAPLPPADGKLHVGQMAQVIVRSPFPGHLLLSVETDGVVSTRVLAMPASHITVPIEITEACRPNAYVTATVLRAIDPNAAWVIHRAIGVTRMSVDNSDRKLTVQLAVPAEIRPEGSLGVQLRVLNSSGVPVQNAAVTVAAVDEGICRLTGFQTPDPFAFFMGQRALGVHSADLFGQLMPETARPQKQSAVGGDDDSAFSLRRGSPVAAKRVRPVALVSSVLHTDAQGLAHADFSTPEFTGQLRVMAVASAEKEFGSEEAGVLVRSPLLVQSSWPRFAAPGDRFSVPLTIFNNLAKPGNVKVAIELSDADGPLRFDGENPAGSRSKSLAPIAIQPGGQATVAVEMVAQDRIGVAHVRLIASMEGENYQENIELPIRPASPSVAAGGYLTAKPGAPVQIEVPPGFIDGTSKLELRVNSAPLLQLPEGLDYLDRYPYGCLEQTTSTLFPLAYLSDIGAQISPDLFERSRVADKVRVGMLRLMSMQTADGGLAMWPGERQDWPWGSVYAAHFLVEAQAAGFEVPEELRDSLLAYVRGLLNQPEDSPATIELQAYAAYVTALTGKPQRGVMGRLSEVLKEENVGSARFHLAAAWLAAGRRDLAAELIPQALPVPRAQRDLAGNVGSGIRDRAILISTLLSVDPQDPRLPDLVQQLANSGKSHQWCSTQDTAFAVMAIGRYLRQIKTQKPFDTAELWLDGKVIASSTEGKPLIWTAASLDETMSHEQAPGAAKLPAGGAKLEVRVKGAAGASAYVAWLETGVRTTPPSNSDSGMTIRRRYLDDHGKPLDLKHIHSGDLVQVELTIQSGAAIDNVVIEDLLPAGLEIENPRLAGNAADAVQRPGENGHADDEAGARPIAFYPIRTDMRDDRLILVGNLSGAGSGTYLYTARAVTPGKFVLPPVKAECMYDSAINSLFGTDKIEVLAGKPAKIAVSKK